LICAFFCQGFGIVTRGKMKLHSAQPVNPDFPNRYAAGVDVVHGHSSHHAKGFEVYAGKLIIYGAGDLISDYEGISVGSSATSLLGAAVWSYADELLPASPCPPSAA